MMALPQRALTLDEFLALPERKPALEYLDGKVRQKVAAKPRHSGLQSYLDLYFNSLGMPCKIARAFPDLRTTFGGQSRVPDLSVFRWARIRAIKRAVAGRILNRPPAAAPAG